MTTNRDNDIDPDDDGWGTTEGPDSASGRDWQAAPGEGLLAVQVPIDGAPGWTAVWTFEVLGPITPVEVSVRRASSSTEALGMEVLRRVRVGPARQACVDKMRTQQLRDLFEVDLDVASLRRRPGRAGRQDLDYAVVVQDYEQVSGGPKPIDELARKYLVSRSQVSNLLTEAKRRGLMTRPGQGRTGGEMTEKCREVLRRAHRGVAQPVRSQGRD